MATELGELRGAAMEEELVADSVANFLLAVESAGDIQMYRGQGNHAWPVIPSLARKVGELHGRGFGFDDWAAVEYHLVSEFKRLTAPWLNSVPQDRYEWLVLAQHHGMPTVLLDMTTNPLKALFFAVENPQQDNVDGAVYLLDPQSWYTSTADICAESYEEDIDFVCFYPKHINPRLVSQEACFVAFKFPEKLEPFKALTVLNDDTLWSDDPKDHDPNAWLREIVISKGVKSKLRKELSKMGITHQTMFPGLDGIATTLRRSVGWD